MRKFKLSILTESLSFEEASEETKITVLTLLQQATFEIQQQALRLTESAAKGDELNAILQYLSILQSPEYFTRPCRVTDHITLAPIADNGQDESIECGDRLTSQIIEIVSRFPEGISRQGIMGELAKIGVNRPQENVSASLVRLRRKGFIRSERGISAQSRGIYYTYFLVPINPNLYSMEKLQSKSTQKINTLMSKGYSITEIALHCGVTREMVEEKTSQQSKRKAS